ncbi:MAG TPA: fumarate hydratase [Dictyoglomaceae bacterium]|nr:fumarate hydratase [Dictyoglomaceae bacterium]HOL38938.1 fumarate hydratase [Dictyoglomaceae bacterium]HOP94874.1 fumarate hydratase [Dictyoglomaceae bacterium]HPP15645.1 fumarate hydratase [Dictyoglomaceae bacterium]HPU43821.1 fumarate hydratase [Dictyoglomaceae bacterium]
MYRFIKSDEIYEKAKELLENIHFNLPKDVISALKKAKENEKNSNAQIVLEILLENAEIAKSKKIPICQDCGIVIAFLDIGQNVCVKGDVEEAINRAIKDVYSKFFLRKSVVRDPMMRINTEDNTPAIIHFNFVPGNKLKLNIMVKGFGSENASIVKNLLPTISEEELTSEIINHIKSYAPNACPPLIIGIGMGGTLEKASYIAKRAVFRPIGERNKDPYYSRLEEMLLEEVNKLDIGPSGLGGKTTALSVNIETYPTHIAGFPLAINMQCCAVRYGSVEL